MEVVDNIEDSQPRPILVTGAHRSGTTWVGRMLAVSDEIGYISEPMGVHHRPGVMSADVQYWYTYINKSNQDQYFPALLETINFNYQTGKELGSLRSIKDIGRFVRDYRMFNDGRGQNQRALLKDPFASFSAPWFSITLHCQVIFLVRHPAAFVSSLKRLDWNFDLNDLLDQKLLMKDLVEPYRKEITMALETPDDLILSSSVLWKVLYGVAVLFRLQYPGFFFIRHEDLSTDVVGGFRSLFEFLDTDFTSEIEQTILASSSPDNPSELKTPAPHSTQLNSAANLKNWKHRLSAGEVDRIHSITNDVSEHYYSSEDWT